MPSVEVGQQAQFSYIQEVNFGVTPATPNGQILRWIPGTDLTADAAVLKNPELRTDMMETVGRRGALRGKGQLMGVLSYGTYDDFIAAATGSFSWTTNVVKVRPMISDSSASLAIVALGKTFTRPAGSFITDGFQVGDTINTSGFTTPANNGTFVISAVTATVITCSTATGLVDEAANAAANISLNIRPSFTVQKADLGNGVFFPFLGVVVDSMELTGKAGGNVEIKFGLVAKSVATEATVPIWTTTSAVNTNPVITAWDGTIKKGGVTLANVVGWNLKLARSMDSAEACGSPDLYDLQPKATIVSGSMEIHFESAAYYTLFRAETDLTLQLNLGGTVNLGYQIDLTKARITKWGAPPKDGLMIQTIEFGSYAPDSGTNTSIMFTRKP